SLNHHNHHLTREHLFVIDIRHHNGSAPASPTIFNHESICSFKIAHKTETVKQRAGITVSPKRLLHASEFHSVPSKLDGKRDIRLPRFSDEFWNTGCGHQARRHAAGKRITGKSHQGNAD